MKEERSSLTKSEMKKEESDSEDSAESGGDMENKPEDAEVRDVRYKLERLKLIIRCNESFLFSSPIWLWLIPKHRNKFTDCFLIPFFNMKRCIQSLV